MKVQTFREQYETPEELQAVLTKAGGCNFYGEPRFRLIWGWKRLDWIGGEFVDYDSHGNSLGTKFELREVPKYLNPNRWYIEKYVPQWMYGPKWKWDEQTLETQDGRCIPSLGPYPARGDYELSWCLEIKGEYLHPNRDIIQEYVNRVLFSEQFSFHQRLEAMKERERQKEITQDSTRASIFRERDLLFRNPDSGKKSYIVNPKELRNGAPANTSTHLIAAS